MSNTGRGRRNRVAFHILLTLLLLLCFVRYALLINIPPVIMLAVSLLIMLIGDRDEIVAMCMCCIPLHTSFQYIYAVLFGIVCYMIKRSRKICLNLTIIPAIVLVLLELLHCFSQSFLITQFVGSFLPLLLLLVLMCDRETDFDYAFIVRAMAITIAAMCVILVSKLVFLSNFDVMSAFVKLRRLGMGAEETRKGVQIVGGQLNPNTLGIICVLGMTGLLQLRMTGQRKRMDNPLLVLLLVFGVMTSSRTYLVCLALMGVFLLFSQKGSAAGKLRFLGGVVIAVLVAMLLLYLFVPELLEFYYTRFLDRDISNGRSSVMQAYHDFIMSGNVWLWGIGLHDLEIKVLDIFRISDTVPHNGLQEIVVAWGFPGLLVFAAVFFTMWVNARRSNRRIRLLNYIPILIILAKIQVGQLVTSAYTMLALSYAYLSMVVRLENGADVPACAQAGEPSDRVAGAEIELWQAVKYVYRKKLAFAVFTIGCTVLSFGVTKELLTPVYESTVLFYVNNSNISRADVAEVLSTSDISASRSLTDTYITILKSRETINRIIAHAGLDVSYDALKAMMIAYPVEVTEVLQVIIRHPDPVTAERVANAAAELLPVRIAEIIDGTSAKVIDYAIVAAKPSLPSKRINTMIGFMFSFVVGFLFLTLRAMYDNKIREETDITDYYAYPILAAIPRLEKEARGGRRAR